MNVGVAVGVAVGVLVGVFVGVGVAVGVEVGVFVGVGVAVGVGVLVGVAVAVSVGVGVLVAVGVGVGLGSTHVPGQDNSAAPPLPPGATSAGQPVKSFGSHTRGGLHDATAFDGTPSDRTPFGWQHGWSRSPQPLTAFARPAASRSTTSTASPNRVMASVYGIGR
jgi:hypothetical protein